MRGLSLEELSEKADGLVSADALSQYEKGELFPSSTVVLKLASALSVNVNDFFLPFHVFKYTESDPSIYLAQLELEKYAIVENLSQDTIFSRSMKETKDIREVVKTLRPKFESLVFKLLADEEITISKAACLLGYSVHETNNRLRKDYP